MNLADEIAKHAETRPEAVAVKTAEETFNYRQLDTLIRSGAHVLHERGIRRGDVLALAIENPLTTLVIILAAAKIGAIVFSLRRSLPPVLRTEMVQEVSAKFELSDHDGAGEIAGLPRMVVDFEAIRNADNRKADIPSIVEPGLPWLIVPGSGSTGRKKYISISHAQFCARAQLGGSMISLAPSDVLASLSPIDFTSPKERYLAALLSGATIALCNWPQPNPITELKILGVTILDATVFQLEKLLASLTVAARNQLGYLRVLLVGASVVSDGLRRRICETLTPALYVPYGTNEAGPLTIASPDTVLRTPGTIGRPPPGVQLQLVDIQGQPVTAGITGRIRVKSPGLIDTYLDDAGTGKDVFRDGWFHPGDLGKMTPEGELIYCGRADHMMVTNGIHIYPAEIERVISAHPAVRDMAAVPLRSALHQDMPVCAVVLDREATVTEKELLAFLFPQLGAATPQRVFMMERIPRNEQGKLLRAELYAEIERLIEPRANIGTLNPADWLSFPFKSSQALQPMHVRCRLPLHSDIERIDTWLRQTFEVGVERADSPGSSNLTPALQTLLAFTQRFLLIFRALMQAARFPVFDPGRIIGIEPDRETSGLWTALVAVVRLDQIPARAYVLAREGANRALGLMADMPITPENQATLWASLEHDFVSPLRKLSPRGKSTFQVLRVAHESDIPFQHLGAGVFQLGWGSHAHLHDRSTVREDSAIGARLSQNKAWSGQLLQQAGLPVPRQEIVSNEREAKRAARSIRWPVVVKPVDRDRGEGVTVGINDNGKLLVALKLALHASRSRQALVEAEASGVCHRLFIAQGRLLYAVKRLPKSVHGDGRSTTEELIRQANLEEQRHPPWSRSEPFPSDTLAQASIQAMGHTFYSIPGLGERVPLRPIESTEWGGFDEDVTNRIHPDNLDIALRAADLFGLAVAGIDIISTDIGIPWHQNGAVINEVNFAPLLGGAEISRGYLPEYLRRIHRGDGRIPVEAFLGNESTLAQARLRQAEWARKGIACYLTSHDTTLHPGGKAIHLPFISLYRRCKALLLDRQVAAVILVIQNDELLTTGMPVDRIRRVSCVAPNLCNSRNTKASHRLLSLLRLHSAG